jgi:hypothetical protein
MEMDSFGKLAGDIGVISAPLFRAELNPMASGVTRQHLHERVGICIGYRYCSRKRVRRDHMFAVRADRRLNRQRAGRAGDGAADRIIVGDQVDDADDRAGGVTMVLPSRYQTVLRRTSQ